jgi:uncharacterized integral membrane protein (TIGR00698 family)
MNQTAIKLGTLGIGDDPPTLFDRLTHARNGIAVAAVIGIAATFLSSRTQVSAMVFALLFGMALNFLRDDPRCRPGIDMASTRLLRVGVALLGLRITVGEIVSLGWHTVAMVIAGIALTMAFGMAMARWLGLGSRFGVLSGGAVSICGASATLAISSVLPKDEESDRDASFVVISVTALSTVAMIVYPMIAHMTGLDPRAAGIFFGGTIHDVAQVVGAGYSVSEEAGDIATIVKLLRVAMLLPVCIVIGMVLHVRGGQAARSAPVLPWFAVAFGILVLVGSSGWLSAAVVDKGGEVSKWLLVTAMAAIGMKTSLRSLAKVGARAILLVVAETLFIGALVLAAIAYGGKLGAF